MSNKIRTLKNTESEFERERFTHYQEERNANFDPLAKESWELFHSAVDGTDTQYSSSQLTELDEVGSPQVSMNFMYPIGQQQIAFLTADIPMGRVLPEGETDKEKAYVYDKALNAIWRKSKSSPIFRKATKEMVVCGLGIMGIEPSSFYRPGIFDLTMTHVSCFDMYIDPDSKETGRNFMDAEAVYVARLIPERKVKNIHGFLPENYANTLLTEVLHTRNEEVNNRDVLMRDLYEKVFGTYVLFGAYIDGGWRVVRRVFEGELGGDEIKKKIEKEKDSKGWGATEIRAVQRRVFVKRMTILGDKDVTYEKVLPITEYPFAFLTPDDYNSPFIKSPASFLREPQKATNKFYQLVILNAQLASNTRYIGPEGSFIDKDAWAKLSAGAGNTYEYRSDPNLPNGGKPEPITPMPLNSAFYQLAYGLKEFSEYISGIFGITQGDPSQAPDVYSSLQSLQNHSAMRSKVIRARMEMSVSYMWKTALEYLQYYAKPGEILRYIDDGGDMQEAKIDEMLSDNEIITYDMQTTTRAQFPTDRQETVRFLQTAISQIGDSGTQRVLLEESFQFMDLPVADRIVKKLDTVSQLSQEIAQKDEQMKLMDEEIKRLARDVIITNKRSAIAQMDAEETGMKKGTQAAAEIANAKLEEAKNNKNTQTQEI